MDRRRAIAGGFFLLAAACKPRTRSFGNPDTSEHPLAQTCVDSDPLCSSAPPLAPNDQISVAPDLSSKRNSRELAGLKVAIDVGHSARGSDRGAFGGDISEYDLNVLQANQVARELRRRGASVSLFHYPDTTELDERGRNAAGHQVFISIHHNSVVQGHVQGTEVLVDSSTQRSSDQALAEALNRQIVDQLWDASVRSERNRGAKAQSLGVLRHAPSSVRAKCLTESFFISEDGLTLPEAQALTQKASYGIVMGLITNHSGALAKMMNGQADEHEFTPWPEEDDPFGQFQGH